MGTAIGTQIIMSLRGVDNLSGVLAGAGRNVAAFARSASASGTMAAQSLSLSAGAVRGLTATGTLVAGVVSRALSGVVDMAKEMGALSDRAQDAGTTTQTLQKMTAAMQEFGVRGASVEMVSRAFQEMTRRTGKQGAEGFAEILGSIARVNDAQERAAMLSDAFGKQAGMAFQSLVANGVDGLNAALFDTMGNFYAASDEAVATGDKISDKWQEVQFGLKNGFMEAIGTIWSDFDAMLGDTQISLSKWVSTGVRWIVDAFRAVFKAGQTIGIALRGVFLSIAEPVKAVFQAAALALKGELSAAGERLADIPANLRGTWEGIGEELSNVWDGSLFNLPDETQKGMGDALRKAAADARDDWRKAGGDAGKAVSAATSSSSPQFAKALGYGANETLKLLFGRGTGDPQREALREARRTNDILEEIGGGLAAVGVC